MSISQLKCPDDVQLDMHKGFFRVPHVRYRGPAPPTRRMRIPLLNDDKMDTQFKVPPSAYSHVPNMLLWSRIRAPGVRPNG